MSQTWTDQKLDALRHVCDEHADDVIARFFQERSSTHPLLLAGELALHDELPEDERSPSVDAYLRENVVRPGWVNPTRVGHAQDLFSRWGLQIGTALFCASLPEAYAAKKGVQVLCLTGRLGDDTQRRVYETAQMIVDVMTPGALELGAPGYVDVRRVRLMHAAIRFLIKNDPGVKKTCELGVQHPYWCKDWGEPINQEDLLGTLMTFTVVVFESLDRFGIRLSRQEREDYLHAWNLIGYLLGIQEELLPITLESAEELSVAVRHRQRKASDEGREMAGSLVALLQKGMPLGLDDLPASLIRYLRGNEVADLLGVKKSGPVRLLFGPLRLLSTALWHVRGDPALRLISTQVGRLLLKEFLEGQRKGKAAGFSIPTELRAKWKLAPSSGTVGHRH